MRLSAGEEKFVAGADGTSIYYEITGQGIPLLLCDGLLCEGHIWKYLVPALERDRQLIHWNYPGHGFSENPSSFSPLSPVRLAEDGACVLRDCHAEGVVLVGHSLGVQVCLEIWRQHRDLVSALVLLCGTSGQIVRDFHEGTIMRLAVPWLGAAARFVPGVASKVWRAFPTSPALWLAMHSREVNRRLLKPADLADYLGRLNRVDFEVAIRMIEAAGHHDAARYLPEVDVPTLIIAGEADTFIPAHRSRKMANLIPESELLVVPAGTHSLPIELPELVHLRLNQFLDERVATRA